MVHAMTNLSFQTSNMSGTAMTKLGSQGHLPPSRRCHSQSSREFTLAVTNMLYFPVSVGVDGTR